MGVRKKVVKQAIAESIQTAKDAPTASVVKKDKPVVKPSSTKKPARKYAEPKKPAEPKKLAQADKRVRASVATTGKTPSAAASTKKVQDSATKGDKTRQQVKDNTAAQTKRAGRPQGPRAPMNAAQLKDFGETLEYHRKRGTLKTFLKGLK